MSIKNAAIGIVLNKTRTHVLIVKRRDVPVWVLPGGGIDDGETAEQAVIREILEETGISVKITKKIGEYTPINRLASFTHVFECQMISGNLSTSTETSDVEFYPNNALPESFFPLHRDWLTDALQNTPTLIKKPISRITYLEVLKYFLKHPLRTLRFAITRISKQ